MTHYQILILCDGVNYYVLMDATFTILLYITDNSERKFRSKPAVAKKWAMDFPARYRLGKVTQFSVRLEPLT